MRLLASLRTVVAVFSGLSGKFAASSKFSRASACHAQVTSTIQGSSAPTSNPVQKPGPEKAQGNLHETWVMLSNSFRRRLSWKLKEDSGDAAGPSQGEGGSEEVPGACHDCPLETDRRED
jgi:hypothetical protein